MTVIDGFLRRELPSLEQWLADHGNGKRGDGFDAFYDLTQRTHKGKVDLSALKPNEAAFLRMWMGMQLAVIELCNIEHQNGRSPAETVVILPRVLATAAIYATASIAVDEVPMRQMAKLLTEEFRYAAKVAADQLEDSLSEHVGSSQ